MSQASPRSWQEFKEKKAGDNTTDVPEGVWMQCDRCKTMLYRKALAENLHVCPECDYHYRIPAQERVKQLLDPGSFEPKWMDITSVDPLTFKDRKTYKQRLKDESKKVTQPDAIIAGHGYVKGRRVVLACLDPNFMMGSMGSVVGEVVTLAAESALKNDLPLIIISCSGGARMQESGLSLMQMAKSSAALSRLHEAGGLFISLLTDPTTGGVTASFAMLGDFILAEKNALIGFAGPRVIANTVKQNLPEGFQRAEFLQAKGFVDKVVHRKKLRSELAQLIDFAGK